MRLVRLNDGGKVVLLCLSFVILSGVTRRFQNRFILGENIFEKVYGARFGKDAESEFFSLNDDTMPKRDVRL